MRYRVTVSGGDPETTSITLDTVVGAPSKGVTDAAKLPAMDASPAEAPPAETPPAAEAGVPEPVARVETEVVDAPEVDDAVDDFGAPFVARSFGGEFIWANAPAFTSKVLRIRAGEVVVISTRGRSDMTAMLTGGRAILEREHGGNITRDELEVASPVAITADADHRLVAMTEVELFTIFASAPPDHD